jgi:hypothetical protein
MSSEVSFDTFTQGQVPGDVEGAEVSGPGGSNALPLMVKHQARGETVVEAFCFTDIYRIPVPIRGELARDVDAGPVEIDSADGVELKRIGSATLASPMNNGWGCLVRYKAFR